MGRRWGVLFAAALCACTLITSLDDLSTPADSTAPDAFADAGGSSDGATDEAPPAPPPDATTDATTDACEPACAPDASTLPVSCKALLGAAPGTPSGPQVIDPDGIGGAPAYTVPCDMTSAGGGWTIIFLAGANEKSNTMGYTGASARLLEAATETLLVHRTEALAPVGSTAVFALPAEWRMDSPFRTKERDLLVSVSINGGVAAGRYLRYGWANFNNACEDAWISAEAYGRLCINGTSAPFYSGWAVNDVDFCADSSEVYTAHDCVDRRFSIAVR